MLRDAGGREGRCTWNHREIERDLVPEVRIETCLASAIFEERAGCFLTNLLRPLAAFADG